MIPGIVLGFGIGLAAYGCSRLLFGALWSGHEPDVQELQVPQVFFQPSELAEPVVAAEPVQENLTHAHDAAEAPLTVPEEAFPPVQEELPEVQGESPAPYLDSGSETTVANEETEIKSWYLIATSKGKLRACKCSSWTAHTVAGPFATKKEAQQAKQQHE
jgi:hypothetical protein